MNSQNWVNVINVFGGYIITALSFSCRFSAKINNFIYQIIMYEMLSVACQWYTVAGPFSGSCHPAHNTQQSRNGIIKNTVIPLQMMVSNSNLAKALMHTPSSSSNGSRAHYYENERWQRRREREREREWGHLTLCLIGLSQIENLLMPVLSLIPICTAQCVHIHPFQPFHSFTTHNSPAHPFIIIIHFHPKIFVSYCSALPPVPVSGSPVRI